MPSMCHNIFDFIFYKPPPILILTNRRKIISTVVKIWKTIQKNCICVTFLRNFFLFFLQFICNIPILNFFGYFKNKLREFQISNLILMFFPTTVLLNRGKLQQNPKYRDPCCWPPPLHRLRWVLQAVSVHRLYPLRLGPLRQRHKR